MKKLLILLNLIPLHLFAQELFELNGVLKDEHNVAIPYGDVLLYKNNTLIQYTTVSKGEFKLFDVPKDNYVLKVSCLGYASYESHFSVYKDRTITIILKEDASILKEVALTVRKKLIEYKDGNTVINIENSVWAKESSTMDLLSKLPAIQLSPDQSSITIVGKGSPLLYVGGQHISMEEFQSISIEDISRIEIINNPSSKYEANGRAVIQIYKKKSETRGINLSLSEKIAKKTYFNNYFSTFLTLKDSLFEYKFNASYNQINVWESNGAHYDLPNQNIQSDYLVEATTNRTQFLFGGGLFYQLSDSNYLSFSTRFRTQHEPFSIDTESQVTENDQTQQIQTLSDNRGKRHFSSTNFNYTNEFNSEGSLFIGAQYTRFKKNMTNAIVNQFTSPLSETRLKREQDFDVKNYTGKADFQQALPNKARIEAGMNYATTVSNSNVSSANNAVASEYKEAILGIYTAYAHSFKKINFRAGVRMENTKVHIANAPEDHPQKKIKNTYAFPKLNIDYKLDSGVSVNFNYAKSIHRPNFTSVTTTSAFINPGLEFRGNIHLKPTLTDEISAAIQYKERRLTARYYRSKDPVYYSIDYDQQKELSVMAPKNFTQEHGYSLGLETPVNYKFWRSTTSISLNYTNIQQKGNIAKKASPYLYFSTQHNFSINENNSIHLNAWGQTKHTSGIFNPNGQFVLNASYHTSLVKNVDLSVTYANIFDNLRYKDRYVINQVSASSIFYTDVREISISIKYTIDSIKKSAYKNKDVDDQLNRVR